MFQDALSEVSKVYPPLKPKEVLVDVIKLHAWIKNFCKQCRRVTRKLQYVTKKTKLKLSLTEGGKEGKSKIVASNKYLESKRCGRSVWDLTSGTRPQSLERNEKRERKCVCKELLASRRQKAYMTTSANKVLRLGVSRRVWGASSLEGAMGRTRVESHIVDRSQRASKSSLF